MASFADLSGQLTRLVSNANSLFDSLGPRYQTSELGWQFKGYLGVAEDVLQGFREDPVVHPEDVEDLGMVWVQFSIINRVLNAGPRFGRSPYGQRLAAIVEQSRSVLALAESLVESPPVTEGGEL